MVRPYSPEIEELVGRAAGLEHGLAFLHLGPLEHVAVTLGADTVLVERARACLDDPRLRPLVIEAFRRARAARPPLAAGAVWHAVPPQPPGAPPIRDPEALIAAAESHPFGLRFFLGAPPETVAIVLAADPFAVEAARAILSRRGHVAEPDSTDGPEDPG